MAGIFELVPLTGWCVALALSYMAFRVSQAIVGGLDFTIPVINVRPLHGLAVALENSVVEWFDDMVKASEAGIAKAFTALKDSLELFAALTLLLGFAVYKALAYLWNTALPAFVKLQTDLIRTAANKAQTLAEALPGSIASNLGIAKTYAETQAEKALSDAQIFASTQDAIFMSMLRSEFGQAVDTLRAGASAAATAALTTAQAGITAAERLAAGQVLEAEQLAASGFADAERLAGSALAQSEAAAKQALAEAEARGATALAGVRDVAVAAGDDLATIEGKLGALGTAGLIASIPAIATLVHAIATEAGLDDAACRAKNKGICGTDPLQWAGLLAGLAALGLSFDLSDVVKLAAEGVGEAGLLLADVGKIPQDVIVNVGGIIGQVAAGIAA